MMLHDLSPDLRDFALSPGATAQLIVDAPRFVALGADDLEPARADDLLMTLIPLLLHLLPLSGVITLRRQLHR